MGQQQLLLIVLGVIIVGIAVIGGIAIFRSFAISSKRDMLASECVNLAAMAQQYYLKPRAYGGGGNSFVGWSIPEQLDTTANGVFTIESIEAAEVFIRSVGNEKVTSNDFVEVTISITPQDYTIDTEAEN